MYKRWRKTAEYSTDFLDALVTQDPLFHWQQVADVFPFGYDFDSPKTHKKVFIPISHANKVAVTPEGGLITMSSHAERNGVPLPDSDPTDPVIKKSGQTPPIAPAITISLAALMAELNRHDRQQMSCQVDVALASKRVTVIGKDEVGASQIMEAVADVYGLRVRHAENGVLILTRLRDLAAPDITRLGKALRGVTPAPLIRALHARMRAQQSPPLRPNQPLPPAPTENGLSAAGSSHALDDAPRTAYPGRTQSASYDTTTVASIQDGQTRRKPPCCSFSDFSHWLRSAGLPSVLFLLTSPTLTMSC